MQLQAETFNEPASTRVAAVDTIDPSTTSGIRLHYIDSLRGLAALAVVILHAFEMFGLGLGWAGIVSDARLTGGLDKIIPFLYNNLVGWGAMAVEMFIVLSGYSLMIGVARSQDGRPKGGLRAYFLRRIRRIWPPYYAALFVSLAIILIIPGMNQKANVYWDLALPVTFDSVAGHLLFLQHLNPGWFFKINPPMWTVAIEEWIYVLFPFLLLPIWRRFGSLVMVAVAVVLGVGAWYLFPSLLQSANPWYLGLFALGALGASIGFSHGREQRLSKRLPWLKLSLGLLLLFVVLTELFQRVDLHLGDITWFTDLIFGVGILCLLVHYTELWKARIPLRKTSFLRVLNQPALIGLGRFSYSLYLLHTPVLALVALLIRQSGLVSLPAYLTILVLGVPVAVACAYLFHRVFERPFMSGQSAQSAVKHEGVEASAAAQL
ncbi:MAG: acyltransferase [Chloroflexota bacterium]